ncbi:MAG: CHAT domain-containing protein [Terriglobales bacterium]
MNDLGNQGLIRLPDEGGFRSQFLESYRSGDGVSFKSAYMHVAGTRSSKVGYGWVTLATALVTGLNVHDTVTADLAFLQLSIEHPLVGYVPSVSFLGTRFENLRIAGRAIEPVFDLGICDPKPDDDKPYLQDAGFLDRVSQQNERINNLPGLPDWARAQYHDSAAIGQAGKVQCSLVTNVEGAAPGTSFGHYRRSAWLWQSVFGQANGGPCIPHGVGRCKWRSGRRSKFDRPERIEQRRHKAVAAILSFLILLCGLACSRESPQASFDHAYGDFAHGDLRQSQEEANREYLRFNNSSPEWAWRFRILEAESLLWQGMYAQALTTLGSPPARPDNKDLLIEILAIEGAAHAHLHQFPQAEEELEQATQMCQVSSEATCGDVIRARGSLAVQHGQIEAAGQLYGQSLRFAHAHDDHFLEETALLNLGLISLREGRFDEAIDWTNAAYQAATILGAEGEAQAALGNLGWAYYNLGDSEKSLELSLAAEKGANHVGDVADQLSWITNAGYVYAGLGDLARAKQSYLKALGLATKIGGKESIYNALRALALVEVAEGNLEEANKYADQAIAIARADNNRLDELYPLLVEGLIAAHSHDEAQAERIFREVDQDKTANASLRLRSEHALARLYEDENRADAADHEYRTALATFEAARSSLRRNDSKLPFSNNASRIYDDYIHFLVSRGKTGEALRWADYSRARTLAEGLGLLANRPYAGPPPLNPQQIARRVGGTVLFYWLGGTQSYLWAVTPQKTSLFTLPPGPEIDASVQRYSRTLGGPQDVLQAADPDGQSLYRTLVAPAQTLFKKNEKVFIVPDGSLNNLNFETLLVPERKPSESSLTEAGLPEAALHYWIEDATVADASSLRVLSAWRADAAVGKRGHRLLLVGNSVAPNDQYPELPKAAAQMESVARHFPANEERVFARDQATPAAYLDSDPEQFSYIHFVAHGTANRLSPLDSAIVLSRTPPTVQTLSKAGPVQTPTTSESESFKLYARDIIRHPLHADLVTISACYSAGERTYAGEGLVGLSWAFLRAGAHNVVAALWEATDVSTEQLMDKFYDELNNGAKPDVALRDAKLSLLRNGRFRNPFYWAPFQLYAGS